VVIETPEGDFKLARESEARWDSEICWPGCPALNPVQRLGNVTKILSSSHVTHTFARAHQKQTRKLSPCGIKVARKKMRRECVTVPLGALAGPGPGLPFFSSLP